MSTGGAAARGAVPDAHFVVPNGGRGRAAAWAPLLAIAALRLVLHLAVAGRYGYFRDELYYLASTRHLDWGYVEHPPLSIAVLWGWVSLFGDSLPSIRALPALAGAAMVVLTGVLARTLGGGRWAQALAGLAVAAAPEYLGSQHIFSMNALDQLFWTVAALLWVRALQRGGTADWAWLGAALGLGLLNKVSVLWLCAGIVLGTLASSRRRVLLSRGPWLAAGVAALLFLPHVIWQVQHDWPVREFVRNATRLKMVTVGPLAFLKQQWFTMNPATALLWVPGLLWCLLAPGAARWRGLGVAWLTACAILILNGTSRASYLAPAYPLLLAPGACALEAWSGLRPFRWVRWAAVAAMIAFGAFALPFALPVLSPADYVRYSRATGFTPAAQERHERVALPQHFADQFGWDEMAQAVARAYRTLTLEERAHCAVFGQNYGEAGAIDVLGRKHGLPAALSGHNSYWLWGPGQWDGGVLIVIGSNMEDNSEFFERVEQAGVIRNPNGMPYERDLPVFVCRRLKMPVAEAWPRLRFYI